MSLTEKVPVHPASTSPKQHAAEQGGMAAGQDALLDKQPPCCWLYPKCFPTLPADMPQGRRCSVPGILMPSCSRGLLGLHCILAQPFSHSPCLQCHTHLPFSQHSQACLFISFLLVLSHFLVSSFAFISLSKAYSSAGSTEVTDHTHCWPLAGTHIQQKNPLSEMNALL